MLTNPAIISRYFDFDPKRFKVLIQAIGGALCESTF